MSVALLQKRKGKEWMDCCMCNFRDKPSIPDCLIDIWEKAAAAAARRQYFFAVSPLFIVYVKV